MANVAFNLVGAFKGLSLSSNSSCSFLQGNIGPFRADGIFYGGNIIAFSVRLLMTIESAHKKGVSSMKNGQDSRGKQLSIKIYGDQVAKPGAIIVH